MKQGCDQLCFTDEETETKRLGILPQVSQNGLLKGLTASFLLDLSH